MLSFLSLPLDVFLLFYAESLFLLLQLVHGRHGELFDGFGCGEW
jgi:hypothetical protein